MVSRESSALHINMYAYAYEFAYMHTHTNIYIHIVISRKKTIYNTYTTLYTTYIYIYSYIVICNDICIFIKKNTVYNTHTHIAHILSMQVCMHIRISIRMILTHLYRIIIRLCAQFLGRLFQVALIGSHR